MNFDSPSNKENKSFTFTTPESKRTHNTKSPYRTVIKKSRKRDCTPLDSPPIKATSANLLHRLKDNNLFANYPDIKPKKLFGDNFIDDNSMNKRLFSKKHLGILDNVDELTEQYYNVLGSQYTPESLFNRIFDDEKKPTDEQSDQEQSIIMRIGEILDPLCSNKLKCLDDDVNVIVFDKDEPKTFPSSALIEDFYDCFEYDASEIKASLGSNTIFVPSKIFIKNSTVPKNARFVFENNSSVGLNINLKLVSIELYLN